MAAEIPDYFQTKSARRPFSRRRMARRRMIIRILAGVVPPITAGVYSKLEAGWLDSSTIKLPFRGIKKQEKLKLLHISDLHLSKTFSSSK